MECKNFEVEWNAKGMDFNYDGRLSVCAAYEKHAREKAIQVVSRKMVMSRQLITIKSVKVA